MNSPTDDQNNESKQGPPTPFDSENTFMLPDSAPKPESSDSMNDEKMGNVISLLLIGGLVCSLVLVSVSSVIFICQNPHLTTSYKIFTGEPADLRAIDAVIRDSFKGNLRAIMQLGVVVLIATPVARVAFSVLTFAMEKDMKYVVFSSLVLAALLYSLVCAI
ncbi:MAG: DUF1634 domain-containing protein [Candidatus Obscuribacterales bacterium]|jgi:uncharacterized membrane protein|nr:DUF1634 domain-containing protein [Candidatus Obscuribacterales bacterium]